ncbi:pyrroline-5-carboxylate reductase [Nannochloropsis gaditana]|uniref:Pyrroline-5-carboxylate reductase n=1 Tax=Nannochloropsis gaditana TaxID=72520 RepID=W7TX01_9STRA|nr:pyrroline-5-carboxylate reductase [Nannochloropsis gaditana]
MSEAPTRQAPSSSTASSTNASPPHPQHAKPGPLRPAGGAKSGEGEKKFTVGFIGGGMMASALIRGLVKAGVVPNFAISVSDPYKPMRDKLAAEVGVIAYDDNIQVIEHAQVIVLAVKPDIIPQVLRELSQRVTRHHLIISIAAGATLQLMEHQLPDQTRVVRVMPNTPCLVGECAAAFALGGSCLPEDAVLVKRIFSAVGAAFEVKEKDLNAVTGLSGSGPAYVFMMIEAMADGGVRAGLPRNVAMQLAAQTVKGAATMVQLTGEHPGVLKDQVASPGGTTITGIEALEKGGLRSTVIGAVVAAAERSKQLAESSKPTPNPRQT